ncbi:MAG: SMP-30/gluconolactonase/LRE family protein [Oceanicaulis sp.]|nr:SMP-30/gluconolactonase/LRE family protein [Oceanicaulis sp.]
MRYWLIGLGLIAALIAARVAYIVIPASGALTPVSEIGTEDCQRVPVAPGTEDVTIDPVTGLAFVSAQDRRAGAMAQTNGIYVFDPAGPGRVRRVSNDTPADFRPHGISLWRGEGAEGSELARLFVISHPASGSQVLIFDIADDGSLTHLETVTDPAIRSPNDVVGVGPRQFYITNDTYFGDMPMGYLEAFLGLPLGSVAYFNGETARIVADGFIYTNGINVNAAGDRLYVAAFLGREVRIFERNASDGALRRLASHRMPMGADNIEIGPDGALYVGGGVDVFAFLAHAEDPDALAPSIVMRLDPETGERRTVFMNDGSLINSASVGAVHDGRLAVGAVFDGHVLLCPYAG